MIVVCGCGVKKSVRKDGLYTGNVVSCGCHKRDFHSENLAGSRFGKLLVQRFSRSGDRGKYWLCLCDCGKTTTVSTDRLRSGEIKTCGCGREMYHFSTVKHGMTHTKPYKSWTGMRDRCNNKNNHKYKDYGGRGITVCARWLSDFRNFYDDMGPQPNIEGERISIDRKDNDKGYWCGKPECPECGPLGREPNCRWATDKIQANNQRPRKRKSK